MRKNVTKKMINSRDIAGNIEEEEPYYYIHLFVLLSDNSYLVTGAYAK